RAVDREQPALAARARQRLQDIRSYLEVPCVVDIAGLKDRSRRSQRVTATFERDGLEVGLVRVAELVVHLVGDDVSRLERVDDIGACADRFEVAGRVLELLPLERFELL